MADFLYARENARNHLEEALATARSGGSAVVTFTGPAGIGKSTLLQLARDRATEDGLTVLRGAASESAGAPAWWPWIQVLRGAARVLVPAERARAFGAPELCRLLPGWVDAGPNEAPADSEVSRFAVADALAQMLRAVGASGPTLLTLDDLHLATRGCLEALELSALDPPPGVALVCAWRSVEASLDPDRGPLLARIARAGRHHEPAPLDLSAVRRWMEDAGVLGEPEQVLARTEGLPLFVEGVLTRLGASGSLWSPGLADPARLAIDAQLDLLGPDARDLLRVASVSGRTFRLGDLQHLTGLGRAGIEQRLGEGRRARVVEQATDGWRFHHLLQCEALLAELDPSRRRELHRALAERLALQGAPSGTVAWHHLKGAAGPPLDRVLESTRQAVQDAVASFAMDQARDLTTAAIDLVLALEPDDVSTLASLRLDLARLDGMEGAGDRMRRVCQEVLALPGLSPEVRAEAALTHSLELAVGQKDPRMIAMLEGALAALPPERTALRARVQARLAAAQMPPWDGDVETPRRHIAEAEAAARASGDLATLYFVLRFKSHTLGYTITYDEQLEIVEEVLEVARRAGLTRSPENMDHRAFRISGPVRRGEVERARRMIEAEVAELSGYRHPNSLWRVHLFPAALESLTGQLDRARERLDAAGELLEEHPFGRGRVALAFGELAWLVSHADPARAQVRSHRLAWLLDAMPPQGARPIVAYLEALHGRLPDPDWIDGFPLDKGALIITQFAAETEVLRGDPATAARVYDALAPQVARHPLAVGPAGMSYFPPARIWLGDLARIAGRTDEARESYIRGGELARRLGLRSSIDRAERGLGALGSPRPAPPPPPPRRREEVPTLERNGSTATLRWSGRVHHLADSKGLAYLQTLLTTPGREIHCAALAGVSETAADAGEVLDPAALRAYRDRLETLDDALDEAQRFGDTVREERVQAEIEALAKEVSRATGLGGRTRRAASAAERARINVQRRIKDALSKVGAVDPELGRYLDATVRTGMTCSFVPL